jgi:hypothetical protein
MLISNGYNDSTLGRACCAGHVGEVAPGGGDAGAVVRPVLGVQADGAVRAQERRLGVVLRQDLAAQEGGRRRQPLG